MACATGSGFKNKTKKIKNSTSRKPKLDAETKLWKLSGFACNCILFCLAYLVSKIQVLKEFIIFFSKDEGWGGAKWEERKGKEAAWRMAYSNPGRRINDPGWKQNAELDRPLVWSIWASVELLKSMHWPHGSFFKYYFQEFLNICLSYLHFTFLFSPVFCSGLESCSAILKHFHGCKPH